MTLAKRFTFPAATLLLALSMPTLSSAEDYQLTFDRPHEAGARYAISGEAYIGQEMHQRVDGQATEEQSSFSEINMQGEIDVLAVNENGGVSELALTAGEYDIEINDEGVELASDMRIIATVEEDDVTYRYENGDAIEGELAELLGMFLDDLLDEDGDGGDTDAMMNCDEPRSPGDTWEMNHDYMIADAAESGELGLEDAEMESEVHFVQVNNANDFGEAMAEIEMSVEIEDFTFPTNEFPEWMLIKESGIAMEGGGMLPIDPTSHKGRHYVEVEMGFLASGTVPGQGVVVEVEFEMERGSDVTLSEMP